jgi:D-sedoheptulose 7-phosphate isomerase
MDKNTPLNSKEQMDSIKLHFIEAKEALETFIADENNFKAIDGAAALISGSIKKGGKIISCGNGGSHCDAMHFAEELSGRFREDRKPYPAISISDPSYISCTANDYGFDHIFSRFVEGFGAEGDVLLAISTSGNSKNVLNAAEKAREKGMKIIALTGKEGGMLASLCDVEIRAPFSKYADHVQEIHIKAIHAMILRVEELLSA